MRPQPPPRCAPGKPNTQSSMENKWCKIFRLTDIITALSKHMYPMQNKREDIIYSHIYKSMYCKYNKIYENLSDKVYFDQPSRLNVLKKEIFLTPTYHIRNSLGLLGLGFSDDISE